MSCLLFGIALLMPRLAIVLIVIFTDWISQAYESVMWPLLGFFLLPYTTLAYMAARLNAESVEGWWLVLVVLAVLLDLGVVGGGGRKARRSRLES